jgi:catechol 2,3-dioxygenase-like lactoylglutathione lyase family enzyme
MRLGHVELFPGDPVGSIGFYRDALGFEVVDVQAERYVWLRSSGREILLRPGANESPATSYQRAAIALVLYTDDMAAACARLAAHGEGCLTFCDPDGHCLRLVELETHAHTGEGAS